MRVLCLHPAGSSALQLSRDLAKLEEAMDASWREIYDLAELVAERHLKTGPRSAFPEPATERLLPAGIVFDHDWKRSL